MVIVDRIIDWLARGLCLVWGHDDAWGTLTRCVHCGKDLP